MKTEDPVPLKGTGSSVFGKCWGVFCKKEIISRTRAR